MEDDLIVKMKKLLRNNPLTEEELKANDVDLSSANLLNIVYKNPELHIAPTLEETVYYLEGEKDLAVKKIVKMQKANKISERSLQIFNATEELLEEYDINEKNDELRWKTLENYKRYKRENEKTMATISREKVREIVKGAFLFGTKQLLMPIPRTRSEEYKNVLRMIGGATPSRPSFNLDGIIRKVKEHLDLTDNETKKLKEKALEIATQFEERPTRYVGKNDLSIAGGYIYVALKKLKGLPEITQETLGEICGVTIPTILGHVKNIRGMLERKRITGEG